MVVTPLPSGKVVEACAAVSTIALEDGRAT
jgi:hypothetical protein